MEKIRTKNLFLTGMLAVAMMFVVMFGFAACGENNEPKELKADDFVGVWEVESNVYTVDGDSDTTTLARFKELHDAGQTSDDEYVDAATVILKFNVKADGTLQWKQYYADDTEYSNAGTWAIVDNKLTADFTGFLAGTVTVNYENNKIIVNQSRMWNEKQETTVVTLAKVAA